MTWKRSDELQTETLFGYGTNIMGSNQTTFTTNTGHIHKGHGFGIHQMIRTRMIIIITTTIIVLIAE